MPEQESRPRRNSTSKRSVSRKVCYYEVLGVTKEVDEQAIKKAYRSLALKWHPDKNPDAKEEAERKFKEIAEAYEVLSNSEKRTTYDRWGMEGLKNGGGSNSTHYDPTYADPATYPDFYAFHFRSPFDVFKEFFGGRDPFQDLLAGHFHKDFFGLPRDHMDAFFPTPILLRPGVAPHGFLGSHYHLDPLQASKKKDSGFCSTIRFTSGEPGQAAAVRKTSTTTKMVDGKKVITKKTEESGQETVEVLENGKLKSKTINGVLQTVKSC